MKKQIKFLFIVFFLFIICLSISIIVKHYFDIQGDYLSGFSTLVAAAGAFYLFNDWKDEHKISLIQQSHLKLRNLNSSVNNHLNLALLNFSSIEGSTVRAGEEKWLEGIAEQKLFITDLSKLIKTLDEYISYLSMLKPNSLLLSHKQIIMVIRKELGNVHKDFMDSLLKTNGSISQSNRYVELLVSCSSGLSDFNLMSEKGLTDFYVNYLNSM